MSIFQLQPSGQIQAQIHVGANQLASRSPGDPFRGAASFSRHQFDSGTDREILAAIERQRRAFTSQAEPVQPADFQASSSSDQPPNITTENEQLQGSRSRHLAPIWDRTRASQIEATAAVASEQLHLRQQQQHQHQHQHQQLLAQQDAYENYQRRLFGRPNKNLKPVHVTISSQTVNGLLSLLALFVIAVYGSIGAILIMSALTVIESLQTRGNCYLVSLAMAHLLVTLLVVPSGALKIMAGGALDDKQVCHYQWLTLEFVFIVSQLSFMLIAADNYLGYKCSELVVAKVAPGSSSQPPSEMKACDERQRRFEVAGGEQPGQIHQQQQQQQNQQRQRQQVAALGESTAASSLRREFLAQSAAAMAKANSGERRAERSRRFRFPNLIRALPSFPSPTDCLRPPRKTCAKFVACLHGGGGRETARDVANHQPDAQPVSGSQRAKPMEPNENDTNISTKTRLARQFAHETNSRLQRPGGLFNYRNCCGRLKVLLWILAVWFAALVYVMQKAQFSYGPQFCSSPSPPLPLSSSQIKFPNASNRLGGSSIGVGRQQLGQAGPSQAAANDDDDDFTQPFDPARRRPAPDLPSHPAPEIDAASGHDGAGDHLRPAEQWPSRLDSGAAQVARDDYNSKPAAPVATASDEKRPSRLRPATRWRRSTAKTIWRGQNDERVAEIGAPGGRAGRLGGDRAPARDQSGGANYELDGARWETSNKTPVSSSKSVDLRNNAIDLNWRRRRRRPPRPRRGLPSASTTTAAIQKVEQKQANRNGAQLAEAVQFGASPTGSKLIACDRHHGRSCSRLNKWAQTKLGPKLNEMVSNELQDGSWTSFADLNRDAKRPVAAAAAVAAIRCDSCHRNKNKTGRQRPGRKVPISAGPSEQHANAAAAAAAGVRQGGKPDLTRAEPEADKQTSAIAASGFVTAVGPLPTGGGQDLKVNSNEGVLSLSGQSGVRPPARLMNKSGPGGYWRRPGQCEGDGARPIRSIGEERDQNRQQQQQQQQHEMRGQENEQRRGQSAWLALAAALMAPSVISSLLFSWAYIKMREVKRRPYKPMPAASLALMPPALLAPRSPIPLIAQRQVYAFDNLASARPTATTTTTTTTTTTSTATDQLDESNPRRQGEQTLEHDIRGDTLERDGYRGGALERMEADEDEEEDEDEVDMNKFVERTQSEYDDDDEDEQPGLSSSDEEDAGASLARAANETVRRVSEITGELPAALCCRSAAAPNSRRAHKQSLRHARLDQVLSAPPVPSPASIPNALQVSGADANSRQSTAPLLLARLDAVGCGKPNFQHHHHHHQPSYWAQYEAGTESLAASTVSSSIHHNLNSRSFKILRSSAMSSYSAPSSASLLQIDAGNQQQNHFGPHASQPPSSRAAPVADELVDSDEFASRASPLFASNSRHYRQRHSSPVEVVAVAGGLQHHFQRQRNHAQSFHYGQGSALGQRAGRSAWLDARQAGQNGGRPLTTGGADRAPALSQALANVIRSVDDDEARDDEGQQGGRAFEQVAAPVGSVVGQQQRVGPGKRRAEADADVATRGSQRAVRQTSRATPKPLELAGSGGGGERQPTSVSSMSPLAGYKSSTGGATTAGRPAGDGSKVILRTYSYMADEQLLRSNIIVFIVHSSFWLPFVLLLVGLEYGNKRDPASDYRDLVWWLATLNCCSCSYLYALSNKDFREAFNKLFYYLCCKSHVTYARKTPIFRRQLDVDRRGNLRVHIIPGLNVYSSKLFSGDSFRDGHHESSWVQQRHLQQQQQHQQHHHHHNHQQTAASSAIG